MLTEIEQTRARKDFQTAQFYARIGRRESAAFYHRQVVALYPGTPWAVKSTEAMDEAAGSDRVAANDEEDSE